MFNAKIKAILVQRNKDIELFQSIIEQLQQERKELREEIERLQTQLERLNG